MTQKKKQKDRKDKDVYLKEDKIQKAIKKDKVERERERRGNGEREGGCVRERKKEREREGEMERHREEDRFNLFKVRFQSVCKNYL